MWKDGAQLVARAFTRKACFQRWRVEHEKVRF
jgi:hypothetical protein